MKLIIDIPNHIYEHAKNMSEDSNDEYEAMRAIAKAEKERPHGEAIYKDFDDEFGVSNMYWCSCCDFPIVQIYMSFCGNCGAKLKKKGEAE